MATLPETKMVGLPQIINFQGQKCRNILKNKIYLQHHRHTPHGSKKKEHTFWRKKVVVGVSKNRDTPKWMVYFRENLLKIDDSGGFYPLFSENILGFDGRVSASLLLFDLKHACSTWRQSQKHPGRRPAETGKKKLHPKQVPKMTTKMRTLGNVDVFIYLYIYCY